MKPFFCLLVVLGVLGSSVNWSTSQAQSKPVPATNAAPLYYILESSTRENLALEVNLGVQQGFKPLGGVAVATTSENGGGRTYTQAMGR